ncbi:MAG: hypothetical protein F6K21_06530 [Symploca sp. SIO2D2]|nr:hypothetical protein [Symploca sp. SIO2D2]
MIIVHYYPKIAFHQLSVGDYVPNLEIDAEMRGCNRHRDGKMGRWGDGEELIEASFSSILPSAFCLLPPKHPRTD